MDWSNKANLQLLLSVSKLGKKWSPISKYISYTCVSISEDEKSKFDPQKCSVQYNYLLETTRQASGDNENLTETELLEKAKINYLNLRKQEICHELAMLEEKESLNKQEKELIEKGQFTKLQPQTVLHIRKYCRSHELSDQLGAVLNLPPLPQNPSEDADLLLEEDRVASVDICTTEASRIWTEESLSQQVGKTNDEEWIPIDEEEYRTLVQWQPSQLAAKYPQKRVYRREKLMENNQTFSIKRQSSSPLGQEESSLDTVLCKPIIHWSEIERCTGKINPWNLDPTYSESNVTDFSVPLMAITEGECDEPLSKSARHSDDLRHLMAGQSETGIDDSGKVSTIADSPASSSASGAAPIIMSSSWSSNNHPVKFHSNNRNSRMDKLMRQSSTRSHRRSRCDDSPLPDKFNRSHSAFIGSLTGEANVWNVPDNLECDRKRWRKTIMTALSSIMTHRHSHVFTHPVTDDIAPGYSDIVFRPMDLSTIRRRLDSGEIQTTGQFLRDLLLMFTNARMYNSSSHEVFKMAEEMAIDILDSLLPLWNKAASKSHGPGLNLRGSGGDIVPLAQTQLHPVIPKKSQSKSSSRTRQYSSSSEASIPPIVKK